MTERITLADCKNAGFCIPGVRRFVDAAGIDFRTFAKEGIPTEQALAVEGWQAMVRHIIKIQEGDRGR